VSSSRTNISSISPSATPPRLRRPEPAYQPQGGRQIEQAAAIPHGDELIGPTADFLEHPGLGGHNRTGCRGAAPQGDHTATFYMDRGPLVW
jgi:hypothetical protein